MALQVCKKSYIDGEDGGKPVVAFGYGVLEKPSRRKMCFCPALNRVSAEATKYALERKEAWTNSLCWAELLIQTPKSKRPGRAKARGK